MCVRPFGLEDWILLNFDIYSGEGRKLKDTVLRLMDKYVKKGHILYMDNFYNSVQLTADLLDLDTGTCGTLRRNRGQPKGLMEKGTRLARGEIAAATNGGCMILSWKDKKLVTMISTEHGDTMAKTTSKRGRELTKPKCVLEYNMHMKGVDQLDQNIQYYQTLRRSVKWTKKVFLWLVQVAIFNTYVMEKVDEDETLLTHRDVLDVAVNMWLSPEYVAQPDENQSENEPSTVSSQTEATKARELHKLTPLSPHRTKYPQRKCVVCKKRCRTKCIIPRCATGLCSNACGNLWSHTRF